MAASSNDYWGDFTDPKEKHPEYRYLTLHINPYDDPEFFLELLLGNNPETASKLAGQLYLNPRSYTNHGEVTLDIIGPENVSSLTGGLLVKVKPSAVLERKEISDGLLGSPDFQNEQAVALSSGIEIVGFFAPTLKSGFIHEAIASRMQEHAKKLSLPFVSIKVPTPYKENCVKRLGKFLMIQHEGRGYLIEPSSAEKLEGLPLEAPPTFFLVARGERSQTFSIPVDNKNFHYLDETGRPLFPSPSEFHKALHWAEKNRHLDAEERESYSKRYKEADLKRKEVRVVLKKGEVDCIEAVRGYGDSAVYYLIRADGSTVRALESSEQGYYKWVLDHLDDRNRDKYVEQFPGEELSYSEAAEVLRAGFVTVTGSDISTYQKWGNGLKRSAFFPERPKVAKGPILPEPGHIVYQPLVFGTEPGVDSGPVI